VALRDQEFPEETQRRILAKTTSALTKIYTTEVLSKPRKRQGVYRAASTPSHTSKKVPADQRVQFSAEEVKKLNNLNEQIASQLYMEGITTEQFMTSLVKDGRAMLPNLKAGLVKLKLNFSPEDTDLLLRKFNSLLDSSTGGINFGEFSHLFPKRQLDHVEEEMREDTDIPKDKDKDKAGERKERGQPKRALTLNPFPQTKHFKNDTDSETSKSGQDDEMMSDDEDEEREPTPPREIDDEV